MTDSPFNLVHLEEYRKQKSEKVIMFSVDTAAWSGKWFLALVAQTPTGWYTGSDLFNPKWPFLRWRLQWAKRRLLRQWRIVCEMES